MEHLILTFGFLVQVFSIFLTLHSYLMFTLMVIYIANLKFFSQTPTIASMVVVVSNTIKVEVFVVEDQ